MERWFAALKCGAKLYDLNDKDTAVQAFADARSPYQKHGILNVWHTQPLSKIVDHVTSLLRSMIGDKLMNNKSHIPWARSVAALGKNNIHRPLH